MLFKKFDFSLCYLNNFIYVIGGKTVQNGVVNTCERYCIKQNKWESISPLNDKRYAATATQVESGLIFVFGGRGDYQNEMVNSIEKYSVDENK